MTTLEILQAARARIADPAHWTQGALARDAQGQLCHTQGATAIQWSAAGAIFAAAGGTVPGLVAVERFNQQAPFPYLNIVDLNEQGSHADVLACFDRTIAYLESGVQA